MAEVAIVLRGPHSITVVQREGRMRRDEYEWQPQCSCGWVGPAYPDNDRGSADQAGVSHYTNARWSEPFHSVMLVGHDQ